MPVEVMGIDHVFIPVRDVSGVVQAPGAGASDFKAGDAVCGMVRWPWGGGG